MEELKNGIRMLAKHLGNSDRKRLHALRDEHTLAEEKLPPESEFSKYVEYDERFIVETQRKEALQQLKDCLEAYSPAQQKQFKFSVAEYNRLKKLAQDLHTEEMEKIQENRVFGIVTEDLSDHPLLDLARENRNLLRLCTSLLDALLPYIRKSVSVEDNKVKDRRA